MVSLDVLAIAAHPDDIEQTCGGTLLRMAEDGYRTGALDLTAGEMGSRGNPDLRLEESNAAARLLNLRFRGNLRMPDARLENTLAARTAVALEIRRLRPKTVILPYWEARHPDHCRASEIGAEACFLAGLKKLDESEPPHRPYKVIYASLYANVQPTFVVDITRGFAKRMEALLAYQSQYANLDDATDLFPAIPEIEERHAAIARFYGNLIGAKYGEPFVMKETMRVDDVVALNVRSF